MTRRMSTSVLSLIALSILALPASLRAAEPQRLGDLYSGPGATKSSKPRGWTEAGDHTFFIADQASTGQAVFSTKGTAASTRILANPQPGFGPNDPTLLGTVGGRLFWWTEGGFLVPGVASFGSLWSSDGSPAATRRLIPPGIVMLDPNRFPNSFALAGGALYFVGCEARDDGACSVWRSDGTLDGTSALQPLPGSRGPEEIAVVGDRLFYTAAGDLWIREPDGTVTRLLEGDTSSPSSYAPRGLVAAGSTLYFSFDSPAKTGQIWASDGTVAGTRPVTSLSNRSTLGSWRQAAGSTLYFVATEIPDGVEIWKTDGTPQGTGPVTAFEHSNALDLLPIDQDVVILGQRVFVVARRLDGMQTRTVWVSDGEPGSTRDLLQCQGDCPRLLSSLAAAGDRVVFILSTDGSDELWSSDGTLAGTGPVADLCDGPCAGGKTTFDHFGEMVGFLYGRRAWVSDGTETGTYPISPGDVPRAFALGGVGRVGDCWLYPGEDERGVEPWCSTGSPESAHIVVDIDKSAASSEPKEFSAVGDLAVFSALEPTGVLQIGIRQVWASDGSPGAIRRLTSSRIDSHDDRRRLISAGPFAVFNELDAADTLWRTDGTDDGTFPIGNLYLYSNADVAYHGQIFELTTVDGQSGLWRIDGTPDGPRLAVPLTLGGSSGGEPIVVGDSIYFIGLTDGQLWRTDGTEAGTWRVSDLPSAFPLLSPLAITEVDGLVYFVTSTSSRDQDELWRTDGSPDSAERVATIPELEQDVERPGNGLWAHQHALYFGVRTRRSDGGTDGAVLRFDEKNGLSTLLTSSLYPIRTNFASLGDTLFFPFNDGVHGYELWQTDGRPDGTSLAADLNPGTFSSSPADLTLAGNRLYFVATSPETGRELWSVDAGGHVSLAGDIAPGAFSSNPEGLTLIGDTLYFSADDGETGREPWVLADATDGPPAPPPGPYLSDPEIPGFGFKVRITSQAGTSLTGRREPACIPETLCVSGAVPGRSEVFLRVVGPKPNGYLWPTLVKFSTSRVEVWIEQTSTGQLRYYDLAAAAPGFDELPGLFDRKGFLP